MKRKKNQLPANKSAIYILIISILCIIMTLEIAWLVNDAKKDDVVKEKEIVSNDNLFSIKTSHNWEKLQNGTLNENSNLEAKNETEGIYFVAIMEDKNYLDIILENWNDLVVSKNSSLYNIDNLSSTLTKVGNYDAYLSTFVSEVTSENGENLKFKMFSYSIETDNYYGQLLLWTTYSQADDKEQEIKKVAESFIEKSSQKN